MPKKSVIDWISFVKGAGGFLLGFFFAQPIIKYLIEFINTQSNQIPNQIPTLTQMLAQQGIVATSLVLIILILALKFFKTIVGFVIWMLIGILAGIALDALSVHPVQFILGVI